MTREIGAEKSASVNLSHQTCKFNKVVKIILGFSENDQKFLASTGCWKIVAGFTSKFEAPKLQSKFEELLVPVDIRVVQRYKTSDLTCSKAVVFLESCQYCSHT